MKRRTTAIGLLAATTVMLSLAACGAPEDDNKSEGSENTGGAEQSTEDYMEKLIADAQAEGELNVIALPPTWANYGEIIKAFSAKYDIKINSKLPDTDSQTEIDTAKRLKGQADRTGRVRPRPVGRGRQHRHVR